MHTPISPRWLVLLLVLLLPVAATAQGDPNRPGVFPISYNAPVTETITAGGIYDWWQFDGLPGDQLRVTMTASEGLEPLVGLLTPNRDLVARSDDGAADSTVVLTHTLEEAGEFTVVATRVGNADGTSTGRYELLLERTNAPVEPPDRYREVTFLCNQEEVSNVLTLAIEDDNAQTDFIGVSVYGLDGFQPSLRSTLEFDFSPFYDQFCFRPIDGEGPGFGRGDTLQLPGEDEITITDNAVKTNFRDASAFGVYELNVGAVGDAPGRFVVVIDGMTVGRDGDRDLLEIGLGPLAREDSVRVYAVSDKTSRLDPFIELVDDDIERLQGCDDAGRRDCAEVPTIEGFRTTSVELERTLAGGPFDAGLLLAPGEPGRMLVLFGGFEGRTYGDYAIVIVGEYSGR
jgi:hypothetical protein